MKLNIRLAKHNDYTAVASLLRNEHSNTNFDLDAFCERMQAMEADPLHKTIVAEKEGQVVGFIGLHRATAYEFKEDYLRIIALAVSQDHKDEGIDMKLLDFAAFFAQEAGITRVDLAFTLSRAEYYTCLARKGYDMKAVHFSLTC